MVKTKKIFKFHAGIGTKLCQRSVLMEPTTPTTMDIVDSAARPYIIKPRKRQNYRNLQPRYVLIPMKLGTVANGPTTPEKTKKTWRRRWESPHQPNVRTILHPNCTAPAGHSTSVLNQGSREEQAEVTKTPHPPVRKVKHHSLRCETLTDETQGT